MDRTTLADHRSRALRWAYEVLQRPLVVLDTETTGQWNHARRSFQRQRLGDACAFLGIPHTGAHSALGDAQMTLRLVQRMAELYAGEK